MTVDELVRGPGNANDPTGAWPWTITGAKTQGITPGLRMKDAKGTEIPVSRAQTRRLREYLKL